MTLSTTESEISTIMGDVVQAEADEASFSESSIIEDDGEGDAAAASCKMCDETCAGDSQKTLTAEIEKQKTVITKKFGKMKDTNKQKKVHAHNKRVAGDAACTAAQKAKDPAEKKKQKKMCKDLREESSKLTTEAEIESQNIQDQQNQEEKELATESQKATEETSSKSVENKKSQEINKAKLKESTSTRITKETEERITLIKKKIETERIQ